MRHFTRSALTMAAGVAASQSISLLSAPVLTRLYEPETFGLFSSFIVIAGLLSIPATLRYEVAVLLPKADEDGMLLAAGAVAAAVCLMAGTTLVLCALLLWLGDLPGQYALGPWLLLTPALALCISLHNTALGLANRFSRYRVIVAGTVTQQSAAALSAMTLGFAGSSVAGLVFSRFLGYVCAAAVIGVRALVRNAWSCWRARRRLRCLAVRYRQFPLFNVPYSLLGLLSRDFPILALMFFGYGSVAGHFALARLAATFPVNFLTSSLTQVFYRDAVDRLGSAELTDLMWKIMRAVTVGVVPMVVVLAMWSEPLFALVFGESWRESGEIFALLAVPMVFGLLTGWPERVFEVREKQHISLAVQLSFDFALIVVVTLLLAEGVPTPTVLIAYVIILTAYQLTYLGLVFWLSGLGMKRFLILGGIIAALAAAVITADTAISSLGLGFGGLGIMLALTGAASLASGWSILSIADPPPKDQSVKAYASWRR